MKNGIINELITAVEEWIPKGQNLASSLADILYMGKGAVYHRLRGGVAFTIDEVTLLSKKPGISVDQIIGNHLSNKVTFGTNLLHSPSTSGSYYKIINRYQQIFGYVRGDDTAEVYTALNLLLFTLYSSYGYMSESCLCRWIYQNGQMKTPGSLTEIQVEDRVVKTHNKLSESVEQCRKTYFIWDSSTFLSFVKEIKYSVSSDPTTKDGVAHLKDEFCQSLSVVEILSVKGELSEGRKVSFYLPNTDFEAVYTYIEK